MNKPKNLIVVLLFLFSLTLNAQFNLEWSSSSTKSYNTMGWLTFSKNSNTWETRLFEITYNSFSIMTSAYSNTPQYTYDFSDAERNAGYLFYSLDVDLTGDGIVEFYVLAHYGDTENPRQTLKIIDITTGNIIFEKDNSSYFYTTATVWDADNDGILELTFAKYDYPDMDNYTYEVYSTGVATSQNSEPIHNLTFKLEQNYPNPFNPTTTIQFNLNKASNVKVDIFNVEGKLINQIVNNYKKAGTHKISWDGTNSKGEKVSSGTYFYRITNNNNVQTKKMILIK
jgi:hypothetical protein